MIRNQAGQSIGAQMINAADGSAFTGVVTVYLTPDAGTQAIGSVGSGICTHEGNGYHTYRPSEDETDAALIAFTFTGSSAIPQTIQVETTTEIQQSALSSATGTLAVTALDIVSDALRELGVLNPSDPASGEDADFCLRKLNRLLDRWNADDQAIYADTLTEYTLTAALQPHTIGPSTATWTVVSRPQAILGANLIVDDIRQPIAIRDQHWWLGQSDPTLTSEWPSDLYYEPAWPNGSVWLWPVPTTALTIELLVRVVLGAMTLVDTFWMPPGYQDAITLTLAEELAPAFKVQPDGMLSRNAQKARALIFGNNVVVPKIRTWAPGMPGGGGGTFDYRTGRVS